MRVSYQQLDKSSCNFFKSMFVVPVDGGAVWGDVPCPCSAWKLSVCAGLEDNDLSCRSLGVAPVPGILVEPSVPPRSPLESVATDPPRLLPRLPPKYRSPGDVYIPSGVLLFPPRVALPGLPEGGLR